jgi:hypothetical protein
MTACQWRGAGDTAGPEIAPTDAGECTRVVTWYRYSDTPRIALYPHGGQPVHCPSAWPVKALRGLTMIDTPGIDSLSADVTARSTRFLTPTDAPSEADAIIYLMRHLHASDLNFLRFFRNHAAGCSGTVNALAVLSRADEIGAGRIDSLISAREIAQRYSGDETLRALVMGVVPIAGLVAQSARTRRQAEFAALAQLARIDRPARAGGGIGPPQRPGRAAAPAGRTVPGPFGPVEVTDRDGGRGVAAA